jgi:hypothetical protein
LMRSRSTALGVADICNSRRQSSRRCGLSRR